MPSHIPQAKRNSIQVKIALNEKVKTIVKSLRQFNSLKPPKVLLQGRPHKITHEMEQVCVKDIINIVESR